MITQDVSERLYKRNSEIKENMIIVMDSQTNHISSTLTDDVYKCVNQISLRKTQLLGKLQLAPNTCLTSGIQ